MTACLNCSTPLDDSSKYCKECGQSAKVNSLSIKNIVIDFISNLFNVDAKIWKSLRDIWVPGKLTKAFVEGKRISYYNPLRLFLVALFIFFGLFLFQINESVQTLNQFSDRQKQAVWKQSMTQFVDSIGVDAGMDSHSVKIYKTLASVYRHYEDQKIRDSFNFFNYNSIKDSLLLSTSSTVELINTSSLTINVLGMPADSRDFFNLSAPDLLEKYGSNSKIRNITLIQTQKVMKDLSRAVNFALSNMSWAILAIILLLSLLFKLLYKNHSYPFAEHFILHLFGHIRILLLSSLALIISLLFEFGIYLLLATNLAILVYLFLDMKAYYQQSNGKTFLKYFIAISLNGFFIITCLLMIFFISLTIL